MAKRIVINRFDRGMSLDRRSGGVGEFAIAKHFDVLTHPGKLQPMRGMTSHTTNTGIGNIIVESSTGLMFGSGLDIGGTPANGELYKIDGYGASNAFNAGSTAQLSGAVADYNFLVDWPNAGNVRTIHWASANTLVASKPATDISVSTTSLTFSSIGQGFVHPKDKYLYFPYRTSATPYIAVDVGNATPFTGLNATALTLPVQYRAYCLTNYGNYLAIPLTDTTATSLATSNVVALWDRDTTNSLFSETIQWGQGVLKVLNNLNGSLVGVSELSSDSLQGGTAQDYNAIQIKVWNGGAEPVTVAELRATALSGASGQPSVVLQERVNFVKDDRLYFSAKVDPNDGIQPSRIGLWSVGKNHTTGEWTVNLERYGANDNSETSILAAAMVGDYVEVVHSAAGTLTKSINGNASNTTYGATSIYESLVNPSMDIQDKIAKKQLTSLTAHFEPLPTSATVVMKYRVDSKGADSDWVTVATASTAGDDAIEMVDAAGTAFTSGRNYEFRLESTGGAVITAFSYKYEVLETNI